MNFAHTAHTKFKDEGKEGKVPKFEKMSKVRTIDLIELLGNETVLSDIVSGSQSLNRYRLGLLEFTTAFDRFWRDEFEGAKFRLEAEERFGLNFRYKPLVSRMKDALIIHMESQ